MRGVVRTRVGYAGGAKKNPTYRSIGDHTETIEIDYDPAQVTYSDLLNVFWDNHDPSQQSWSRQYKNIIFYHDAKQKLIAEETKHRVASETKRPVVTEIAPYSSFTLAEDYHQKHALRRYPEFMEEFRAVYPAAERLVSSTAAARVNGYLGGSGTCEALEQELGSIGLSPARKDYLRQLVCKTEGSIACPVPK